MLSNPALTVALALAAGVLAQALARHLRMPGIAVLLIAGVLLGPDVAGVVRPQTLGSALSILVSFAVAVILFEGGLTLDLRRIRRESHAIRQLATVGVVITATGGTLLAKLVMGWDFRLSILFGTLVMVTGPTVINPLLRRLKVAHSVTTVLETEGVLVDALGAVVATVGLEIAVSRSGVGFALGAAQVLTRLGFGALAGLAGGALLALLLRYRNLVPEGLENIFALSLMLALFQTANTLMPESGLAAVVVAGALVGNAGTPIERSLLEFKEQLTVLFIGMLFILLAADVRIAEVRALGTRGIITVLALMWVVRPLAVFGSTSKSSLGLREKLFISWIGPRGIVAAAVASLFAVQLDRHGVGGGNELRALVFLVIAVSVVVAGLTGNTVARLLGLKRKSNAGWILLGANELALTVAEVLGKFGEEVVCIDTNPHSCRAAEERGLHAVFGNALDERILHRAQLESRVGALALAPNDSLNLLFIRKVKQERGPRRLYATISAATEEASRELLAAATGQVLFGAPVSVEAWCVRIRHQGAELAHWRLTRVDGERPADSTRFAEAPDRLLLPLIAIHGGKAHPVTDETTWKRGSEALFLVDSARAEDSARWLNGHGWVPVEAAPKEAAS